MTLREIYRKRTDNRLVAYRPGKLFYVALGHKTYEAAVAAAVEGQDISQDDLAAIDWMVGEVVPHDDERTADQQAAHRQDKTMFPPDPRIGTVKWFRKVS